MLTRFRNAEARFPSITFSRSRSKRDDRVHDADSSAPSRSGTSGPPRNRSACAHESSRVIAGGDAVALPAFNAGGEPMNSIVRIHDAAGRRGTSDTAMPGALTSIGIRPVATSTRSHCSTPGISSGAPVPLGLVMSASPTRYVVCVQVLPCAPTRAGDPALMPPVSMRSPITSGTVVRSGKRLALVGRPPSASTVIHAPSGGRSWDATRRLRAETRGGRERDDRDDTRRAAAIESGHAGNHFQ